MIDSPHPAGLESVQTSADQPGGSFLLHERNGHAVATKKIAIVGKAPSTMNLAPYDDPSWEIWGLSNAAFANEVPRWDTWFELHNLNDGHDRWKDCTPGYWSWLKQPHEGKRLFIGRPHAEVPHGIVYPWQRVFASFGHYLNNSVSAMIAIALLDGVTDLALYGVDMAQSDPALHNGTSEYQHQRPSCEYFIGLAIGRGVRVSIPAASDLLKVNRVYAYEDSANDDFRLKMHVRLKELKQRHAQMLGEMKQHQQHAEQARMNCIKFEGAIEDLQYVLQRIQ